ncbi:MAG: L-lactate dehydrogenase [Actinomycetaceae bacterium]|jgi:L-lactate dehydrogenase|nr:L-lactate dehydrogenase [Actinomycetaceae bacterium]
MSRNKRGGTVSENHAAEPALIPESEEDLAAGNTTSAFPSPDASKIAVIGAGAVGSAITYASVIQGVARHYVMYDIAGEKARAEALDIAQGVQFAPVATVEGSSDVEIVRDADVVVITSGAKQKPGQSRLELAGATIDIMKSVVPQVVEQAPNAIFLMVANPVDVVTYAGWKLSGLPAERFFGSGTVLDSSRLRYLIARACGVAPQNVHAYIAGEHGDSEIPLWSSATVGAVPLLQWGTTADGQTLDESARDRIHQDVVRSAYEIIEGKGATNYAIGLSVASILATIMRDEHRVLPVSSYLEDWLGISDVCMSVPCIVGRSGVGRRLIPVVTPREYEGLRTSARSIREVAAKFGF